MLELYRWPVNARYAVQGLGTCLGATVDMQVARLGRMNQVCSGFIKEFNGILKQALGGRIFYWGSLEVNKRL